MNHFPLFAALGGRPVLLIGAGSVGLRKARLLRAAGAQIRLVARRLHPELQTLVAAEAIEWLGPEFDESQLEGVFLAVNASGDEALGRRLFALANARGLWLNTVDCPELCSVIFPAIIDRGPVQLALSSGGTAPVLLRQLRQQLEALLPRRLELMATLAGRFRATVQERLAPAARRAFWEKIFGGERFARLCEQNQSEEALRHLHDQLDHFRPEGGSVTLVGAGSGDPELLTLKGLQALQRADVVCYDALISPGVLDLIRRDAERLYVGKRSGRHSLSQAEINRLLIDRARAGQRVVRLKGGDPFIFGRGGEELQALRRAGIPFTVVPGVSAGLAVSAYAGIPLTHRDHASAVSFISGQQLQQEPQDWARLVGPRHTLVIYMGTAQAARWQEALLHHGRAPTTPVALISQGTLAQQRIRTGTLAELAELAEDAETPALIIVGETVALQSQLHWFGAPAETRAEALPLPA